MPGDAHDLLAACARLRKLRHRRVPVVMLAPRLGDLFRADCRPHPEVIHMSEESSCRKLGVADFRLTHAQTGRNCALGQRSGPEDRVTGRPQLQRPLPLRRDSGLSL